jgi:hypothetical protein
MHHLTLPLQPGGEPFNEHIDYIRDSTGFRLVIEHSPYAENPANICHIPIRIAHSRAMNGGRSFDVASYEWLAAEQMHRLPDGFAYYGKYFPAAHCLRGNGDVYSCISTEEFTCAHCAYLKAVEICAAEHIPGAQLFPLVYQVSPGCTSQIPETHFTTLLDDDGQISVSCATEKLEFDSTGCGNCGFPGHRRDTCPRGARAYDKIGVEIEGRFFHVGDVETEVRRSGATSCGDSSIRDGFTPDCYSLEIQTKPGTVVEQLRQLSKFYPDEADASCGMHIHVSFADSGSISTLVSSEFMEYFTRRWEAWGRAQGLSDHSQFFRRLRGENDYCVPNEEDDFESPYDSDRYRQLNFRAWNEHQTVECRLLPMFRQARLAYSALVELVSIYEDWLAGIRTLLAEKVTMNADISLASVASTAELDLSQYLSEADHSAVDFEVAELPPVAEGCVRVCSTPSTRAVLGTYFPAAA